MPDLVIMDMQMPGMSGLQATGALRALPGGADVPILALTAQAMAGDRERILDAGCDDYLSKPVAPRQLRASVTRLLAARRPRTDGPAPAPVSPLGEPHGAHTHRR
jgi:CheY-like chemotaxis protein